MHPETRFRLPAADAISLARTFGTPLYVLDEATLRDRIRTYQAALNELWPATSLTYASKANGTLALLQVAAHEGCGIDCAGAGELLAASRAAIPPSRCHLHGNAKSPVDLELALELGVGMIVVDSTDELEWLIQKGARTVPIALRINPGVGTSTHQKISTGHLKSKFGIPLLDGRAEKAVQRCQEAGLNLVGFHIHLGSQLREAEQLELGASALVEFAIEMMQRQSLDVRYLNLGGGIAVRQLQSDPPVRVGQFLKALFRPVAARLLQEGVMATLAIEPGRSVVAEAGVTLYHVMARKDIGDYKLLAVDGGMSDNPSPALYDRNFDVVPTREDECDTAFSIYGAHCESDLLFPNTMLPADSQAGDTLQVLCTGAYNSSMASNYNRFRRPATIMRRLDGTMELVQQREDWKLLLDREHLIALQ